MKNRPIVMYLGGFAKVGGIETFARDFLLAMAEAHPAREVAVWGRGAGDNPLLADIAKSGAKITRCFWRWGCRWNLPDYLLAPFGWVAVRRAGVVIFQRPPPSPIMRWLRAESQRSGRSVPFVLIMPYRPAEYWHSVSAASDLRFFDVVTVQSEEGARDLASLGFHGRVENIPLLPPGEVPPVEFPSRGQPGKFRLGFLGRLEAPKNLGYLLEVYRELWQAAGAGEEFELHIFGDGAEMRSLKADAADRQLPNVFFHGAVPRAEVSQAIDSCDLFLNTSRTEGQCIVALEVLGRGRPFVATPVGALPEVLASREVGRLAPLDDAPGFAAEIREVLREIKSGQLTPGSVAKAFHGRFDRPAIVQRYLDLLSSLITPEGASLKTASAT